MNQLIAAPPRTIMQVFKTLPEGTMAEVIENSLYMSPAPSPFHQEISMILSSALHAHVRKHNLGKIFTAPIDLYLDEQSNAVQPDILFISKNNPLIIDKVGLHGSPDLIIEILSPGNKDHDLIKKKSLYEKFRVQEYWIVDPDSKQSIGYHLVNAKFEVLGESAGQISTKLFGEVFTF